MKTVALHTLGCKLNFAETSTLGKSLEQEGYRIVDFHQPADVYVINTCSVTDQADRKCRHMIRQALRSNESAFIAVTGCYAQLKPQEIAAIPGVDIVLGAGEKFQLPQYLKDLTKKSNGEIHACAIEAADVFESAYAIGDRTRSFLKVQDGCDYNCSFCTIPLARGSSRSSSIAQITASAAEIAREGIKEIVLTGVNIGDFGKGERGGRQKNETFLDLIRQLDEVEGIDRFRISSIEPNLLSNEIIDLVGGSRRFMPHFHIPLQSGSNKLLKLMRRRYVRELYAAKVEAIHRKIPGCCIGVDVIVGFPGESDEDFLDTYHFLNDLDIAYLHVFTYSERDHTHALSLPGIVPVQQRRERSKMLRILSEKKKRAFYQRSLGRTATVLWEDNRDREWMFGYTEQYLKVKIPYQAYKVNTLETCLLQSLDADGTVTTTAPTAQEIQV